VRRAVYEFRTYLGYVLMALATWIAPVEEQEKFILRCMDLAGEP